MRASRLGFVFAFVILVAGSALAQDWDVYTSKEDGFKIDFPAPPKVASTIFKSEYGADLPAKVYTVDRGREHYKVTVADYTQSQRILDENASKTCPKDFPD